MSIREKLRPLSACLALSITLAVSTTANAAEAAAREECVEAHGRGQDLREHGQLARARQTFLACAQSTCPALVQQDCARFSEELAQLVPTVTFGARDASAADLPAAMVYVDDVLLATRLDDGRAYELDPGKHVVRYVHDGKETTLRVVLNQGERGRLLVASFGDKGPPKRELKETMDGADSVSREVHRSAFPLLVAGLGAAATVAGGVLFGVGSGKVPTSCSMSTKECAAAPGAPVFAEASAGVKMANIGIGIGIGGAVALVGGVVWYFVQPGRLSDTRRGFTPSPFFTF